MVSTQYRRVSGPIIPHIYVKQKKNDFSLSQTMGFHDTCGILGSVTDPKIQLLYPKENSQVLGKVSKTKAGLAQEKTILMRKTHCYYFLVKNIK